MQPSPCPMIHVASSAPLSSCATRVGVLRVLKTQLRITHLEVPVSILLRRTLVADEPIIWTFIPVRSATSGYCYSI
jgi:hypothetical protein